ncbi:LysR family transcriptional regulator [Nitratidesulfovibrio sp. D1]|uniref:LysR family transcriptional regulator n=1 Tax=Nitratidesulfovibrio sp. D1 TaxID=3440151 RepID=UPI003EBEEF19
MEFRVLRYFLTVAREQSISAAAQSLHVTQPTLSRQIMELEAELGVTLFHRGRRNITLTTEGMLLRKRAEQIVELMHKTEEELAASEEAVGGTVYIGAGETHAFGTLAKSIRSLVLRYPDVRFHISSGNADEVAERLDKGLVDFGLFIEPADVTKYDCFRLPSVDVWGVLMRKDSPLAALDAITPEALRNQPLICSHRALREGHLTDWLKTRREDLNLVATFNLIFNASLLVEAGVGYALGLDNIINTTGESTLCFRPLDPPLESHVALVWKKYQVFSKASKLFLDMVRAGDAA